MIGECHSEKYMSFTFARAIGECYSGAVTERQGISHASDQGNREVLCCEEDIVLA